MPPVANGEHSHRHRNRRGRQLPPRLLATSSIRRSLHRRATHRRLPSTARWQPWRWTGHKAACCCRSRFRRQPHRTRSRRMLPSRPASSNRSTGNADPSSVHPQRRLRGLKSPRMTRPCSEVGLRRSSPGLRLRSRVGQRPRFPLRTNYGHWRIVQAKCARPTRRPVTGRQPPQRQVRSDRSLVSWRARRRRHRHTRRPLLSHRPSRRHSLPRRS
jgi:hypothetical protein